MRAERKLAANRGHCEDELVEQVAVPYHPTRYWATPDGKHLVLFEYDAFVNGEALKAVVDLEETV